MEIVKRAVSNSLLKRTTDYYVRLLKIRTETFSNNGEFRD